MQVFGTKLGNRGVNVRGAGSEYFQAIFDSLTTHIAVLNAQGIIVAVNEAWATFPHVHGERERCSMGIGAAYLQTARQSDGPYSEEGQSAYVGIKAVLDGSLQEFTLEYPCPAAAVTRWFELRASPLPGQLSGALVLTHLDITARKQAEDERVGAKAALFSSELRHRRLFESAKDGVLILDAVTGKIIDANPYILKLLGYSLAELLGKKPWDICPFKDIDACETVFLKLQENEYIRYDNLPFETKDGRKREVEVVSNAYHMEDRLVIQCNIRDNSERKKAEKSLQESQQNLHLLIEASPLALVVLDAMENVILWNPAAERLFGWTMAEAVGRPPPYIPQSGEHDFEIRFEEGMEGKAESSREARRLRKDGSMVDVSLWTAPMHDSQGQIVSLLWSFADNTERKSLEAQFRQAQKMEAVGRLAGGVAHDFNNLLTVISGYSEMLLKTLPAGNGTQELVKEIHKAGERAASLTGQLLAFSRKQVLEPKPLDLNALMTDCEQMLRRLVGEDVNLVIVPDPALGLVKTDLSQMEQVLMNLVINARDAMPRGGKITIETANIALDQTYCRFHPDVKPGSYVMLAVSDTGAGMDEETKSHLFEPFFTTKALGKGTGLGLAMVHGFIKQSGGQIFVYSEPGLGSAFKIYLPEIQAQRPSGLAHPEVGKLPRGEETILLVEDEGGVRALSRHILQDCGYTVLEASHGAEAVCLVENYQGPIHLLATDVVMPGMDGRHLAQRVGAVKPKIKVLYISGYTDDAVVRHGILESETAFLQKPFTPSRLACKVRDVLDHREGSGPCS